MRQHVRPELLCPAAVVLATLLTSAASAQVTYAIVGTNWPADRRAATEAAADAAVARYNAFGGFQKHISISFNPAVPTADGNFNGSIRIGATVQINERLLIHEINHTLGIGTVAAWNARRQNGLWTGPQGLARVRQFDGDQAVLNADTIHFWPYGLNFNGEDSELARERSVAVTYEMLADMGLVSSQHPSTASLVRLTATDPAGESGFRRSDNWQDGYAPHEGADYLTGQFILRTPAEANAFTFAGDAIIITDPAPGTGLWYSGTATSAAVTIPSLVLSGGWLEHRGAQGTDFILRGNLSVVADSFIRPAFGNVIVQSPVTGSGSLTLAPGSTPDRVVRFVSSMAEYSGSIAVQSGLAFSPAGGMRFNVRDNGVANTITGDAPGGVLADGTFSININAPGALPGDRWPLFAAANTTYGTAFSISGFAEVEPGLWSDGAFRFEEATGTLTAVGPCTDIQPDGASDFLDVLLFLRLVDEGVVSPLTDIAPLANPDGVVDSHDIRAFLAALAGGGSCP